MRKVLAIFQIMLLQQCLATNLDDFIKTLDEVLERNAGTISDLLNMGVKIDPVADTDEYIYFDKLFEDVQANQVKEIYINLMNLKNLDGIDICSLVNVINSIGEKQKQYYEECMSHKSNVGMHSYIASIMKFRKF